MIDTLVSSLFPRSSFPLVYHLTPSPLHSSFPPSLPPSLPSFPLPSLLPPPFFLTFPPFPPFSLPPSLPPFPPYLSSLPPPSLLPYLSFLPPLLSSWLHFYFVVIAGWWLSIRSCTSIPLEFLSETQYIYHNILFPPAVYWPTGRRDCATALGIQSWGPEGRYARDDHLYVARWTVCNWYQDFWLVKIPFDCFIDQWNGSSASFQLLICWFLQFGGHLDSLIKLIRRALIAFWSRSQTFQ